MRKTGGRLVSQVSTYVSISLWGWSVLVVLLLVLVLVVVLTMRKESCDASSNSNIFAMNGEGTSGCIEGWSRRGLGRGTGVVEGIREGRLKRADMNLFLAC